MTTEAPTKNFLGIPIEGDIIKRSINNTPQKPGSDLAPAINALSESSDETFVGIKWRQYTPYFADGDVCEFSVHDVFVRYTDMAEDAGDYGDGWVYTTDVSVMGGEEVEYKKTGTRPSRWNPGAYEDVRAWVPTGKVFEKRGNAAELAALQVLINSGSYDNALLDAFGDHAEVTLTKTGFLVDEYEHE